MTARILHLSADYPDSFQPNKTRAIAGLVEGTADQFEHLVISLNRAGGLAALLQPGAQLESRLAGQVLAVRYAAPPAIVAIARAMDRLADRLASRLQRIGFQPDLIQAHKLTVEGPLAMIANIGIEVGEEVVAERHLRVVAAADTVKAIVLDHKRENRSAWVRPMIATTSHSR